jgi:type VI secretion system protein VasD
MQPTIHGRLKDRRQRRNLSARLAWSRRSAAALAALVALLWVTGPTFTCAEPAPADGVTAVELTIVGGPALNPNVQGRPSPVVVRIFDLSAATAFESADFTALFDQPGEPLKYDVVAQEELVLRPGDIQQRNRGLQPQVRALGVVAAFRDLEHAVWRATVPVKLGRRNFLLIDLDQDRIRVETVDPGQS